MGVLMLYGNITDSTIKAFYKVYNNLGYGFLEKVYENAMRIELNKMDVYVEQQKYIRVYYQNEQIGEYYADLLIEGKKWFSKEYFKN